VLGSPRTQQLLKYDQQKVTDLQEINYQITSYYTNNGVLANTLEKMTSGGYYVAKVDPQTQKPYEYQRVSDTTYKICAEFNKASDNNNNLTMPLDSYGKSWTHPLGYYCFTQVVNPNLYSKPVPVYR